MVNIIERQADAVPDDMLGSIDVTREGVEAVLSHMAATEMVRWNQSRWEALEFLRDILARIQLAPAIPDEKQEDNQSGAESCEPRF
jgi:sulfur relay (sulfurtransferase) DsrC/TusE family protein